MAHNEHEHWIWFRGTVIGCFKRGELPQSPGRYDYESFWCDHNNEMLVAAKAGKRPCCYYQTRQSRMFFTVLGSPEPGLLDLCDFEPSPPIVPDGIVDQLSGIYRELVEQRPFSDIARVSLMNAGASGRALELHIWQCESDDLALPSISRRQWTVDAAGTHPDRDWGATDELMNSPDWWCERPSIKFSIDGERVHFVMCLGPRWYVSRVAPIGPDGKFISDKLVDARSYFASLEVQSAGAARVRAFWKRLATRIRW